jgi:hypothetical protein
VATGDVRPLTHFAGDVIPEFAWNRSRTTLIWSAAVVGTGRFRTQLGRFSGPGTTPAPRPPRGGAAALVGAPIDMGRVTGDLPPAVTRTPSPSSSTEGSHTPTATSPPAPALPPVVASYTALWLQQLGQLGALTAGAISRPSLG